MGVFAETSLWGAAREVLQSDTAANTFCAALDAHLGFLHRSAQHRQRWQALTEFHSEVVLPAGLEGVIQVPLHGPAGRPLLDAAAAHYRFCQKDPQWEEATWDTLTRKEKSGAWKRYDRLLNSGKGARQDVARRRLLIEWIDNQVRKLGGRLTFWTEDPLRTRGVRLVVEVFKSLGLGGEETAPIIVEELKRRRQERSVASARRPRSIKIMPPLTGRWLSPDGVLEGLSPEAQASSREVNWPLLRGLRVRSSTV